MIQPMLHSNSKMREGKKLLTLLMGLFLFMAARAQVRIMAANDSSQLVIIKKADRLRYEKRDSLTEYQMLAGNVVLQQENTLFYCDSAVFNRKDNLIEAFGNVHINDADSIHTYSQYLIYYGNTKKAYLKKNVRLTDGKGVLTTNELEYDTQTKIGTYTKGGKVVNGKTVLTSEEATYYGDMKDVYFKKNVNLKDPQYILHADSLLYNTDTQIATFITQTFIQDTSNRNITTSEGYYDMKNKLARFGKRPVIKDKGTTVIGDEVGFDDNTGESFARGNAVFRDSAQGIAIIANDINANKKKNTLLATQNPILIIQQDKDSIYVTADTLFSGRLTDMANYDRTFLNKDTIKDATVISPSDTTNRNRFFQAYHHVRIFSDSLQAVADSLFYSGVDSVFRLFQQPIVWASGSQVTGDTIYLYTRNKDPERVYVFENGMVINRTEAGYYNQLRGNTLNGYFKDGAIDNMRAKGSAESIYYAQDDQQAYVGVNRATADVIDIFFLNKELNKVVFRSEVNGTMTPFGQVNHDEMKLRSFQWLEKRRPKTRFELFEAPQTQ
ncbi:hypothetical protein KJS94_05565 [Flavihumibacter rivuli]|uniref:OstA-like protein n=1 Tax=Flavihumibacter rivuli TaxID=2838156 RepID=UPI001BDEC2CD|nr:OstA-like protein [Flavihumibacter rivuli]ULQ57666.1 hypothetical protein KJS94_05565 [Flavihumibacter rivuli]